MITITDNNPNPKYLDFMRLQFQIYMQLIVALFCCSTANAATGSISPSSQSIFSGGTPTTLTLGGPDISGYRYSWTSSSNGTTFYLVGATGTTYTPPSTTQTMYYQVMLTSTTTGAVVYSSIATVKVVAHLAAGSVTPTSANINYGASVTLTSTAATGGISTTTYQWQSSTNGSTYTDISGATALTYTSSLTASGYYRLKAVNSTETVYTNVATITVYPQLQAGTISPTAISINNGTSPGQLTGTVATGGNGTYTYLWQYSTDNANWYSTGGTSQNYTPGSLTTTTLYRRVAGSNTVNVNSNTATVTVYPAITPGAITPTTQTINYNTVPATLTSAAATGGNGTYSYQWQSSTASTSRANISGATALTYTPAELTNTTYYYMLVTSNEASTLSATTTITVLPQITTSITPAASTINYNTSPGQLTNTVTGGNGTYTFQWQSSANGTTWTNISGATSQNYTAGALTATTYFHVITTSNGASVTSNTSTITVYPQLIAPTITPSSQIVNYGSSITTITSSGLSGGSGTYTYQWQSSADATTWSNINGATTSSYTPPATAGVNNFRLVVTSNGVSVTSNTSKFTYYTQLLAGPVTPEVQTIPYYTSPATLTSTTASGGAGSYTYQWQSSADAGTTWSNISGATALTLTPAAVNGNMSYRMAVTSNGATVYSTLAKVYTDVYGGVIGSSAYIVSSGGGVTLSSVQSAANGNCTSYTYQWQSSPDEINWTNISSTTITGITANTYYRRITTCGAGIAYSNTIRVKVQVVVSQPVPDGSTAPVAGTITVVAMPAYTGMDVENMNYVRTRVISRPITDTATASSETNVYSVSQTTSYFDGLGRPIQTVTKQATPSQTDIISTNFYDQYGREVQKYLAYTDNTATGKFKTDANIKQPVFYNTYLNNTENYYYANNSFEASPLNRVLKTSAPGKSWTGHDVGIKNLYRTNTLNDSVIIWKVDTLAIALPESKGYYTPGALQVNEITDEHGNKVIEFKDKEGLTILRKAQVTDAGVTAYENWLSSYSVYDDMNRIRYQLSPKATQYLCRNNWVFTATIVTDLCFKYFYDNRGQLILKKVPGAGAINIVYDARGRLVMAQDSLSFSKGQWIVTVYDSLNRATKTVLWSNTSTPSYHQTQAYNAQSYPVLSGTYTVLTETFYDDYSWQSNYTDLGGTHNFVSSFINNNDLPVIQNNPYVSTLTTATQQTRGLVTGIRTKILDANNSSQYVYSINWYDADSRLLQMQYENITGGWDTLTNRYDFSGKILSSCEVHNIVSSTGTVKWNKQVTAYNYDAKGRLLTIKKYLDGSTNGKTIKTNTYDDLGNLKTKVLGNNIENFTYDYNIQGWQTGINKTFVNTAGSTSNWFGQELDFDYGSTNNQLNGNIGGTKWKSGANGMARAYGYVYDPVNRLTTANFTQQNNESTSWTKDKADFSVNGLSYDANGNINGMVQKGMVGTVSRIIDKLTYTYQSNGNKLLSVADTANTKTANLGDFIDGTNTNDDYNYDVNGNLIADQNKHISKITYNYLNRPDTVFMTEKGYIRNIYDAMGNRLKKIVVDSTQTPIKITTTTYTGSYTYNNDTLQYVTFEEGRLRPAKVDTTKAWVVENTKYTYDYFVKDYLRNIRMVLTEQTDTTKYAATMETAYSGTENALFNNIDATRTAKPTGYPDDPTTSPNASVARLNANNGQKIGPSLVLRVMAGDTIQLGVKAFYTSTSASTGYSTTSDMLNALISAFSGSGTVADGSHLGTGSTSPVATSFTTSAYDNLKTKDADENLVDKPKAYLNFALFDDQFNMVDVNSGVKQVQGNPNELQTLALDRMAIKKTGFIYIYTSNESAQDVYFDNLIVVHNSGPILEENHYYPYGLTMSGLSSSALKGTNFIANKLKFGGKEMQDNEFTDGTGLEWYDFDARMYDVQTARWMVPDAMAEKSPDWTPYRYAFDNPIRYIDPDGNTESVADMIKKAWNNTPEDGVGYYTVQNGELQEPQPTDKKADEIRDRYRNMIASARKWGADLAADNLQHFIDGSGTPVTYSLKTLKKYHAFRVSLSRELNYYGDDIRKMSLTIQDGHTITFKRTYAAVVDPWGLSGLYFASGLSQISTEGTITMTRKGNQIIVSGDIKQSWHDKYNWNKGMSAWIPGFGDVSDEDGLYLKENGGASDFRLGAVWHTTVSGTITVLPLWIYHNNFHFTHKDVGK